MLTPIFFTGFEHGVGPPSASGSVGLYDLTNTDSITIVTSPAAAIHSGTRALQISQTATTRTTGWNFTATNEIILRFYVYLPSTLPSASVMLMHNVVSTGKAWNFRYNQTTGKFQMIWGGTTGAQDSTMTVAPDTLYRVECKVVVNAATRTCDWRIAEGDGAAVVQTQSASTETAGTTSGLRLGGSGTQTMTAIYDDVFLSVTAADYPIGVGSTEFRTTTADGTHNPGVNIIEDQAGADIGVVTAWDLLDDDPLSGTADYVRQFANEATKYAEVLFADTTRTNILGVIGEVNVASSSAGFSCNAAMVIIRQDATEVGVLGTSSAPAAFTSSGPFYKRAIITPPGGGWTQAEVNALKGRCGFSTDTNPIPRLHAFALEVAYGPAAAGRVLGPAIQYSGG